MYYQGSGIMHVKDFSQICHDCPDGMGTSWYCQKVIFTWMWSFAICPITKYKNVLSLLLNKTFPSK